MDDRDRNQGMKEGGFGTGGKQGQGGIHEMPGRNPQKDKQAGQGLKKDDPNKGIRRPGQQGGTKEGGQDEPIRR